MQSVLFKLGWLAASYLDDYDLRSYSSRYEA